MKIERLKLKKFRNYDKLDIKFNDKLNIIIGNNAQGKTNILEAIYFLSITKSFLSINDKNCMKKNEVFTKIEGNIRTNKGKNILSLILNENGKKLEINDNEIKKHSDYIGNLKVIIFNPDNIRLIKDAPGNRRRFLNIEISQLYGKYINLLNEFNVVLKQRNEYLKIIKNNNYNEIYFSILNEKFVELSYEIYKYRISFIDNLNKYIGQIFKEISGFDGLYIKYIPSVDILDMDNFKTIMLNKLKDNYDRELIYGNSLYGPHRDDFSFKINENDLLLYGSQGQLKMAILALKLSEIDVFNEVSQEYPILLLDDLFSELDVSKRNNVISYLNRDIQTILTTTDLENINSELIVDSYVYKIDDGKIIQSNYDNREVRDKNE